MHKLSIIIINYNTPEMTEKAIRNFIDQEPELSFVFILVDNSTEKFFSSELANSLGINLIINKKNVGFARAVNQGLKEAGGEYVLLLNSDVLIENRSVSRLINYMEKNKDVGIIGPRMVFPDGRLQLSCGRFPAFWREFFRLTRLYKIIPYSTFLSEKELRTNSNDAINVDWVSGGCLLIKRELFNKLKGTDEKYFLGGEDFDLGWRANQAGFRIIYYPKAKAVHFLGYSSGSKGTRSLKRLRYDREGIDYFFKKNFPKKKISRFIVKLLNNIRIILIQLTNNIKNMLKKKLIPRDATVAITYACNSRCQMCNIWQIKNPPLLSLKAVDNLSPALKYINLTGGEPFLHPRIVDIVKTIKGNNPHVQIIISTNGLATELIRKTMAQIYKIDKKIGIRVSIDGLKETHNKIRGVDNMFDKAMGTVKALREIGIKNLGISFTIMENNASEIKDIYNLAKKEKLQLALALVQNSDIYFSKKTNKINTVSRVASGLDYIIKQELSSWHPKKWARAFYDYGLKLYALKKERLLPSGAGFDSLFIDPNGKVYPSNLINLEIGDIKKDRLDAIWQSAKAGEVREKIKKENIQESWIICTIRGEMKKKIYKVLSWILINKTMMQIRKFTRPLQPKLRRVKMPQIK